MPSTSDENNQEVCQDKDTIIPTTGYFSSIVKRCCEEIYKKYTIIIINELFLHRILLILCGITLTWQIDFIPLKYILVVGLISMIGLSFAKKREENCQIDEIKNTLIDIRKLIENDNADDYYEDDTDNYYSNDSKRLEEMEQILFIKRKYLNDVYLKQKKLINVIESSEAINFETLNKIIEDYLVDKPSNQIFTKNDVCKDQSIKDLQNQIDSLKQLNNNLEKQNASLKQSNRGLEIVSLNVREEKKYLKQWNRNLQDRISILEQSNREIELFCITMDEGKRILNI